MKQSHANTKTTGSSSLRAPKIVQRELRAGTLWGCRYDRRTRWWNVNILDGTHYDA